MRLTGEIAAPPEAVFRLYTDPARRSEWQPAALAIRDQTGPLDQAGTTYVVETRFGDMRVRVVRVEAPRLYELVESTERWGESHAVMHLDPTPDAGTRLTVEGSASRAGRFGWLLGPLLDVMSGLWGRGEIRRLKEVAERDQRATAAARSGT